MVDLAVISGSGFYDFPDLKEKKEVRVETPFGDVPLVTGTYGEHRVMFLSRHGKNHRLLPNMINYRANLTALKKMKTKALISTTVCGVLKPEIPLARLIVFDDLYFPDNRLPDGSLCTLYNEPGDKKRGHYIFETPFSGKMRAQIIKTADTPLTSGIYAHVNGPRLNSKSEIRMLQNHACCVSQTAGPEVVLAGEMEIPCVLLGYGVDYANGVNPQPTPVETLRRNLRSSKIVFLDAIKRFLEAYEEPDFEGFVFRFKDNA